MLCRNHVDVSEGVRRCARCGGTFCFDCLVEMQGRPYCAICKADQLMDVRSGVDRTTLEYAGNGRRFVALMIDSILTGIINQCLFFMVGMIVAAAGGQEAATLILAGLALIFGILVPVIYEALMLGAKGQTVGKMAMRIKVVTPEGADISKGQAWGRAFARILSGIFLLIGYLMAFFNPEKKTLHDIMAGTRVVNW